MELCSYLVGSLTLTKAKVFIDEEYQKALLTGGPRRYYLFNNWFFKG